MKSLVEHDTIKQSWFGPGNPRREFPVSSSHESIKVVRLSITEDLEERWVANLNEDRKRFFLLHCYLTLAPNFSASVTTNTSPHRGSARVTVFLQWSLKAFTVRSTAWPGSTLLCLPLLRLLGLFSSVGLVKSDLRGNLLDTTLINVMWAKQAP